MRLIEKLSQPALGQVWLSTQLRSVRLSRQHTIQCRAAQLRDRELEPRMELISVNSVKLLRVTFSTTSASEHFDSVMHLAEARIRA